MRIKIKLLILFLEYEQEKYKGAFEKLRSYVDRISFCEKTYVVIDNKHEDAPIRQDEGVFYVGGDNSLREFSGWQKGLELAKSKGLEFDALLVCNNSFLVSGNSYLNDSASIALLLKVLLRRAVLGKIDNCQENMEVYNTSFTDWLCTNCFFMSRKALEAIDGNLVSIRENELDKFLPEKFASFKELICQTTVKTKDLLGARFSVEVNLPVNNKFECQVQIDKVFVPSEFDMGDDNRELGVLIRSVSVEGNVIDLVELSKGGYGVENNTLWMGKAVNLSLETGADGKVKIDCFIQQNVFEDAYKGSLEFSFFDVKSIFKEDAPISQNYQRYIVDWLTHNWHSKYDITESNWKETREKIACLLNEVLLTARLKGAKVRVLGA